MLFEKIVYTYNTEEPVKIIESLLPSFWGTSFTSVQLRVCFRFGLYYACVLYLGLQVVFFPTTAEKSCQVFTVVCDNCQVKDISIEGESSQWSVELCFQISDDLKFL